METNYVAVVYEDLTYAAAPWTPQGLAQLRSPKRFLAVRIFHFQYPGQTVPNEVYFVGDDSLHLTALPGGGLMVHQRSEAGSGNPAEAFQSVFLADGSQQLRQDITSQFASVGGGTDTRHPTYPYKAGDYASRKQAALALPITPPA